MFVFEKNLSISATEQQKQKRSNLFLFIRKRNLIESCCLHTSVADCIVSRSRGFYPIEEEQKFGHFSFIHNSPPPHYLYLKVIELDARNNIKNLFQARDIFSAALFSPKNRFFEKNITHECRHRLILRRVIQLSAVSFDFI